MSKIDVSPEDWLIIKAILQGFVPQKEVWAFGSRARWTAKDYSDLDIVILGEEPLSEELFMDLEKNFTESDLPWKVDIVDWYNLDDDFKKIIEKDYVVIQKRNITKWPSVRLDSILVPTERISYGVVQPGKESLNGVPIVRVSDVRDGMIKTEKPLKISQEVENSYLRTRLTGGELLLSIVGTVGETAIVPESLKGWNIARAIARIPVREDIGARWVQLALKTETIKQLINSKLNTTVQPTLNLRDVFELPVPFPSKEKRSSILNILGSLDDKIDLNRRTNETLEAMARALFRDWFVDFGPTRAKMAGEAPYLAPELWELFPDRLDDEGKPEGWKNSQIGKQFDITMGQSPPGYTYNLDGNGKPFYQGKADFGTIFPTRRMYCAAPNRMAYTFDSLVSVRAPVGEVNLSAEECCIGRGLAAIRHPQNLPYYTYLVMKSLRKIFFSFEDNGTVFGSINKKQFEKLGVLESKVENVFEKRVDPIFKKIITNEAESYTLAQLRDLLLPKLMSGEISIRNAEKMVKDAA